MSEQANSTDACAETEPAVPVKSVTFRFEAPPGIRVFVAGSFNGWDLSTDRMEEEPTGVYSLRLSIACGRYEYKFLCNGTWRIDPTCPEWAPNEYGTLNSVLVVE